MLRIGPRGVSQKRGREPGEARCSIRDRSLAPPPASRPRGGVHTAKVPQEGKIEGDNGREDRPQQEDRRSAIEPVKELRRRPGGFWGRRRRRLPQKCGIDVAVLNEPHGLGRSGGLRPLSLGDGRLTAFAADRRGDETKDRTGRQCVSDYCPSPRCYGPALLTLSKTELCAPRICSSYRHSLTHCDSFCWGGITPRSCGGDWPRMWLLQRFAGADRIAVPAVLSMLHRLERPVSLAVVPACA